MNRAEHLAWAKSRALGYVAAGDNHQALMSIASDLNKHDDLRECHGMTLAMGLVLYRDGHLDSPVAMTSFINGFN